MASGVGVKDECIQAYEEIKMGHMWLYVIFCITDDLKKIQVLEKAGHDKTYDDFVSSLKDAEMKKQCRYAIYDVCYCQGDVQCSKLAFFLWSPDSSSVKQKMLYTSSKQALLRKCQGIPVMIQCNDELDLGYANVLEKCSSKYT